MTARLAKTDAMVAIYILVAFIMLIVPLPAVLLDVFMAFNIARRYRRKRGNYLRTVRGRR